MDQLPANVEVLPDNEHHRPEVLSGRKHRPEVLSGRKKAPASMPI